MAYTVENVRGDGSGGGAIAGRIFVDLQGVSLTDEERRFLGHEAVGGVVLFARNTKTAKECRALCDDIHSIRSDLLISIDHEGGRVQRLHDGVTSLPAAASLGRFYRANPEQAVAAATLLGALMATELREIGVDFSFAPVLDIHYGHNSVIADRAFGEDAETVIDLAAAWIRGTRHAGMASVGKHFPGHGWVTTDSHVGLPRDDRAFSEIEISCLQPFRRLAAELDAVMPAHVIYEAVDDMPAGFSTVWHRYLREHLRFKGSVISDDLAMAAAGFVGDMKARVERALNSGCDYALVCNDTVAARALLSDIDRGELLIDAGESGKSDGTAASATLRPRLQAAVLSGEERVLARRIAAALHEDDHATLHGLVRPMSWDTKHNYRKVR